MSHSKPASPFLCSRPISQQAYPLPPASRADRFHSTRSPFEHSTITAHSLKEPTFRPFCGHSRYPLCSKCRLRAFPRRTSEGCSAFRAYSIYPLCACHSSG
uniref:Uncharacterized protein n=1 Tax=Rhizophora mucronata TaxID=61149 RepID=A0A2P2P1H6_RHIMU